MKAETRVPLSRPYIDEREEEVERLAVDGPEEERCREKSEVEHGPSGRRPADEAEPEPEPSRSMRSGLP